MSSNVLHTLNVQKRHTGEGIVKYADIWAYLASERRSYIARKSVHDIRFPLSTHFDCKLLMQTAFGS